MSSEVISNNIDGDSHKTTLAISPSTQLSLLDSDVCAYHMTMTTHTGQTYNYQDGQRYIQYYHIFPF